MGVWSWLSGFLTPPPLIFSVLNSFFYIPWAHGTTRYTCQNGCFGGVFLVCQVMLTIMADKRDPLVLSNYIFELLEVNPRVAGFLIQLHPEDVDAVVESVTAHAEKGAGTKTTLYVGQEEEEEEVEEEEADVGGVGAGGRKEKPHNPLMISVQKVRIRPGKGKGKSDGWFPQPLTHNTRRVCTDDPENKLPMHSLCPTREWEREWYGVTTPNIIFRAGGESFSIWGNPPPYWGGGGGGCRRALGGL